MTLDEFKVTLSGFHKSKILDPNGWVVEFFEAHFELLGLDLKEAIEETWTSRRIYGAMNATFISLIPKCSNPTSFEDFNPISLCHMVYKVGENILGNKMKEGLP